MKDSSRGDKKRKECDAVPVVGGQCRWRATDRSERGGKIRPLCCEMRENGLLRGDSSVDLAVWRSRGFARKWLCRDDRVLQGLDAVEHAQKHDAELVRRGKTLR